MELNEFKSKQKEHANAVLILNETSSLFKEALLKFAPDAAADIESASVKKDCSCRNKLVEYLFDEKPNFLDFLYNFLIENDLFSVYLDFYHQTKSFKNYSGKVAKTTIKDWKEFSENILSDNGIFKSFSVVKEGDDIFVFFL